MTKVKIRRLAQIKVHPTSGFSLSHDFLRAMHVRKDYAPMKKGIEGMYGKSRDNAKVETRTTSAFSLALSYTGVTFSVNSEREFVPRDQVFPQASCPRFDTEITSQYTNI